MQSKEKWLAAASLYEQPPRGTRIRGMRTRPWDMKEAAEKLREFLSGEDGKAASALLQASGHIIHFASDPYKLQPDMTIEYYLDSEGLKERNRSNSPSMPIVSHGTPIDEATAVKAYVDSSRGSGGMPQKDADDIIAYLCGQLDAICRMAPEKKD